MFYLYDIHCIFEHKNIHKMLISFHLPKAAGISFRHSLEDYYGKHAIKKDYLDYPMNTPPVIRNLSALKNSLSYKFKTFPEVECIHGHFLPLKYRFLKQQPGYVKFVTWMRDPAERIASQYYYMLRNYTPKIGKTQPLYKRIIEEKWSLERYCLSPEFKNTCNQLLWGFPVSRFDFIGIVEDYEEELSYFSQHFLGRTILKGYRDNTNPSVGRTSYFKDLALKSKVSRYHAKDVALYEYALKCQRQRKTLRAESSPDSAG